MHFFDITQLPGPTEEDREDAFMGKPEQFPAAGGAPTAEQTMASQLRQVSAQDSEPQAEPRPTYGEDQVPTADNQRIPVEDDPELLEQPARPEVPSTKQPRQP